MKKNVPLEYNVSYQFFFVSLNDTGRILKGSSMPQTNSSDTDSWYDRSK